MRKEVSSVIWLAVLAGIVVLVAVGFLLVQGSDPLLFMLVDRPQAVMGTTCELRVVVPANRMDLADDALAAAEVALRNVEMRMSRHLKTSDVSRVNAAKAGEPVEISRETIEVLTLAQKLADETDGAFDVTYAPVFGLWARSAKAGRLPTMGELKKAREVCGWGNFRITGNTVTKHQDRSMIDLGGIAKGYGIDLAVRAMTARKVTGGLINVGGDIRCFGRSPDGKGWPIKILDPFHPRGEKYLGRIVVKEGAACTSGNYERFVEIGGKRYNHILDPRTVKPAALTPSVTVLAPTATVADAWATALSVLGTDGFKTIPPQQHIEAMIVLGTAEDYTTPATPLFEKMLEKPASAPSEGG